MKTVSRFEAILVRILQGFFGRVSQDQLLKLVATEVERPRCLSRNAVDLVMDTLRKGVPRYLAQQGGWRRERFLRNEQIAEGRLWHRTPPRELGLRFSRHSLSFLIWITANQPCRSRFEPVPEESELTVGDRFLHYLAYESLRGTDVGPALMEQVPFQNHALVWLAYLSDFSEDKDPSAWDFSPWLTGQGASILESLQTHLAHRWLQMERQKLRIYQPDVMNRIGQWQQGILEALFDVADSAGRKDVCRFFLIALKRLHQELAAITAQGQDSRLYDLDLSKLRMAERAKVYQSAACCFREMRRMEEWNQKARATGFFDEGYAASQLWKADWEQLDGDRLCAMSRTRLNDLDMLRVGSPSAEGTTQTGSGETNASNPT